MADDPTFNPGGAIEILAAFVAPDGFTVVPVALASPLPVALPAGPLSVSLPENPLPVTLPAGPQAVSLPTLLPVTWTSGATMDMRTYTGVTVQVFGLSGGDTIQVSESYDNAHSNVQSWIKNDFTVGNTISAAGNYSFSGGGYMTFAKTGSASTPSLTIAGSN